MAICTAKNQSGEVLIDDWHWNDTLADNDRVRKKQAEFLVYQSFPVAWVEKIAVYGEEQKKSVESTLAQHSYKIPVVMVLFKKRSLMMQLTKGNILEANADNVWHVLTRFEGHFTIGFGEGKSNPRTPIQILPQALDETEKYLAEHSVKIEQYNARLEKVKRLIAGFESPLGLELLATIHWLVKHESVNANNQEEIISKIQSWNQHKKMP